MTGHVMSESVKKPSIGHNGGPPVAETVHLRQAQRGVYADDRLSSSEKLLATYMMNRADKGYDNAYPRVDVIAEDTSLDRKTVISGLRSLVEKGWFSTRQYPGHSQRKIYSVRDVDFLASMVSRFQDRDRERANISYRNERQGKRTYSKYGTENGTGETGPKNGTGSENGTLTGTKNGTQTGGTIPPRSAPSSAPSSASEAGTPPNNLRDLKSPKLKNPTPTPPPVGVVDAHKNNNAHGAINGVETKLLSELMYGNSIVSYDQAPEFLAVAEKAYGATKVRVALDHLAWKRRKGIKVGHFPAVLMTACASVSDADAAAFEQKHHQEQQEARKPYKSPYGRYTKATLGEKL